MQKSYDIPYRRILIKLSGEALMGPESHGFCTQTTRRVAEEIAEIVRLGLEVGIVIGGGNIFRGSMGVRLGLSSSASDAMGLLATVMNGVMFRDILQHIGVDAVVFSSVFMPSVCLAYRQADAVACLVQKKVCIFVAGTGNPYFTTDTAAVLRARDTDCDVMLKATKVPGVFSSDPQYDSQAQHYPTLFYDDALTQNLGVMDRTALILAQEGSMTTKVFSVLEPGSLLNTLQGKGLFSVIRPNAG